MSVLIKIALFGIGDIEGEIIRHLSPLTADALINKLPFVLRGRYSFGSKNYWTLPGIEIYKGTNPKSITSIEKGDILYNPKTDELIIAIEDIEMPNKVNRIGKINANLELLLKARNGLNTKISKL
ncbi:MAG: cyclophilin-like fold protein [Candidatus Thorarchaeota archaeon]